MVNQPQTTASRRLRIFLCHASEDKPTVRDIYRRLQAYNVDVWFDEQNLLPGERWEQLIPDVIQSCDVVIICLSHTFLAKEGYGHYEVHVVLEAAKKKPVNTIFHIPFRLDDCDVPSYLLGLHYVSNFVPGDFEKLIAACEKRREWLIANHGAPIAPIRDTPTERPPDPWSRSSLSNASGKISPRQPVGDRTLRQALPGQSVTITIRAQRMVRSPQTSRKKPY